MTAFFLAVTLSALFSVLLVPISSRLGLLVGAVDLPDGDRKRHAHPTPRFSAPALYAAALVLLFLPIDSGERAALLSGGALIAALGVTDDVYCISPRLRLAVEAVVALLPSAFGLLPQRLVCFGVNIALSPLVALPLTALWVMTLTNAFNLIDGLDGLCATQAAVSAAALCTMKGDPAAAVLFGGCLGFLPYNRQGLLPVGRARCAHTAAFLGDGGALFLGYALAVLSLGESFSVSVLLLFFVPLYDLVSAVLRRLRAGKSPFCADGEHLHHRLLRRGLSASLSVLFLLTVSLFCAAIALFWHRREMLGILF